MKRNRPFDGLCVCRSICSFCRYMSIKFVLDSVFFHVKRISCEIHIKCFYAFHNKGSFFENVFCQIILRGSTEGDRVLGRFWNLWKLKTRLWNLWEPWNIAQLHKLKRHSIFNLQKFIFWSNEHKEKKKRKKHFWNCPKSKLTLLGMAFVEIRNMKRWFLQEWHNSEMKMTWTFWFSAWIPFGR